MGGCVVLLWEALLWRSFTLLAAIEGLLWVLNDPWPLMGQQVWALQGFLISGWIKRKYYNAEAVPILRLQETYLIFFFKPTRMIRLMSHSKVGSGRVMDHVVPNCVMWLCPVSAGVLGLEYINHLLRVDSWYFLPSLHMWQMFHRGEVPSGALWSSGLSGSVAQCLANDLKVASLILAHSSLTWWERLRSLVHPNRTIWSIITSFWDII